VRRRWDNVTIPEVWQHMPEQLYISISSLLYLTSSSIISSICLYNKRRFSDILNDVTGISNKMLSKELKELEVNKLVERTVLDTRPVTVHYELTKHGKTLQTIITNLTDWGFEHRRKITGK